MNTSCPAYAMIVGQGRSGTSWLLDLFDLSPDTFCRNEPEGTQGSPFAQIDRFRTICRHNDDELAQRWDPIVRWTVTHMGERDRPVQGPKRHLWPIGRYAGLYRAVRGPKLRRCLAIALPSLRGGEWTLPAWLGSKRQLADALVVLKLIASPGWASFVLRQRPMVPVIHLVRHPCGLLNSWRNRYLARNDRAKVAQANRERLRAVTEEDPSWIDRFGKIATLSVEESELWYWVYANEMIHRVGSQAANYHLVLYEDLVADGVGIMKNLWKACSLTWNRAIEDSITTDLVRSRNIAGHWRESLSPELVCMSKRVLNHSMMNAWWSTSTRMATSDT